MDRDAVVWLADHRVAALDPVLVGLSVVGFAGLVWIALGPLVARRTGRPALRTAGLVAAAVWGADLATLAVKAGVDRPRPFEAIAGLEPLLGGTVGSSLPSGHAATSAAGALVLSYLYPRAAPALAALALAVAFSRVYVGVHYPTDVLAGAGVGAAFGAVAVLVLRLPRSPSRSRPRSGGAPRSG